jgi:hypothetical protein
MLDLELRSKRWNDGFVELDFGFGNAPEVRTARMERHGAEPSFAEGTPLPWQNALESWCDAHESQVDELTTKLRNS